MADKVVLIYNTETEDILWLKEKEPIVTTSVLAEAVIYPDNEVEALVTDLQAIMGSGYILYSGNPVSPPPRPF